MKFLFSALFFIHFVCIFAQSPETITACNPNGIFAVDDSALSQVKGTLPLPDVNPEYYAGIQELFSHFRANEYSLNPQPFTVKIGVLVNCRVQAGNYEILTKHSKETQATANTILEQVAKWATVWRPGKSHGRFVDCYQVVEVLIQDGKVVKVGVK